MGHAGFWRCELWLVCDGDSLDMHAGCGNFLPRLADEQRNHRQVAAAIVLAAGGNSYFGERRPDCDNPTAASNG
jgi:hypothetical protein